MSRTDEHKGILKHLGRVETLTFTPWDLLFCCISITWVSPWKKSYDKLRQCIEKQRHYFANTGPSSQNFGFSSSHVWIWELNYKENWGPKNRCFWTVVLEKTLESLLDYKEIQPVNPKGDQSWVFIGRTDAKAETPILWPPPAKSWLIGKDSDAGRDWGQEEKGTTLTQWMWVWVNSGSWWWTGRPGVLRVMELQRVGHDWVTVLNWTELLEFELHEEGLEAPGGLN